MTVLVAYNASPHGEAAVRTAAAEAARRRLPLAILDLHPEHGDQPVPDAGLAALLVDVPSGVELAPIVVRKEGREPADAILDATESTGATLVVIGSNKRSSLGTVLLGSTTQRVLLDSPVPVLVVKDVYDR